jgi:hypothetical protein
MRLCAVLHTCNESNLQQMPPCLPHHPFGLQKWLRVSYAYKLAAGSYFRPDCIMWCVQPRTLNLFRTNLSTGLDQLTKTVQTRCILHAIVLLSKATATGPATAERTVDVGVLLANGVRVRLQRPVSMQHAFLSHFCRACTTVETDLAILALSW